jgi:hypothetical protein
LLLKNSRRLAADLLWRNAIGIGHCVFWYSLPNLRCCKVERQPGFQRLVKVVEGNTTDGMGVNKHFIGPPIQTQTVGVRNAQASANNQKARKGNVSNAKLFFEFVCFLVVVEGVEPIDQLAETVVESLAPIRGRSPFDFLENAVFAAVLKFDSQILLVFPVAHHEVGGEITQEGEFIRDFRRGADIGSECPNKSDSCRLALKKGKTSYFSERSTFDISNLPNSFNSLLHFAGW